MSGCCWWSDNLEGHRFICLGTREQLRKSCIYAPEWRAGRHREDSVVYAPQLRPGHRIEKPGQRAAAGRSWNPCRRNLMKSKGTRQWEELAMPHLPQLGDRRKPWLFHPAVSCRYLVDTLGWVEAGYSGCHLILKHMRDSSWDSKICLGNIYRWLMSVLSGESKRLGGIWVLWLM